MTNIPFPSPIAGSDTATSGAQAGAAAVAGSTTAESVERSPVAYRGGRWLSVSEVDIHLASMLRLENVGILLGAGASTGVNGMTMSQLWKEFSSEIEENEKAFLIDQKIAESYHFPHESKTSATLPTPSYAAVSQNSSASVIPTSHQNTTTSGIREPEPLKNSPDPPILPGPNAMPPPPPPQTPDIEALLDTLAISIAQWRRVGDENLTLGLNIQYKLYVKLIEASTLNPEWWGNPSGPDLSESSLKSHREMLQKFSSIRQPGQASPWVFTTNYDLAIEWAADSINLNVINGFLGIHSRKFTPQSFDLGYRNVQAKGEARFGTYNIYLAKLHGSLTWNQYPDGQFYEIQSTNAWKNIEDYKSQKVDELPFTVAPSAAKYVQTVGFIYGELMRRFAEFTGRSQTVLFISGYSFGDEHINRLLRSALLNPTLQLVIYVFELNEEGDMNKLPRQVVDLIDTGSSRITIIGGSYDDFVKHLPDPAIYNSDLKEIRELVRRDGDTT